MVDSQGVPGTLANNAHIAEERGIVDDSGLNEEDRYASSRVIPFLLDAC